MRHRAVSGTLEEMLEELRARYKDNPAALDECKAFMSKVTSNLQLNT